VQGLVDAGLERVFQYALDGGEAGAAANQHRRARGIFPQKKAAERPTDTPHGLFLHAVEHLVGEQAAFDITNVQFHERIVVWCIGDRERTWFMPFDQHVDVLAGQKLHAIAGRQLQVDADHVMRELLQSFHPAGEGLDLDVTCGIDFAHDNVEVAGGTRLAEQCLVIGQVVLAQRQWRTIRVFHAPAGQCTHARTAGAIAAAVWQNDALAQRGIQYAFRCFNGKAMAAGLYGDSE
jgi:hypothetical protein